MTGGGAWGGKGSSNVGSEVARETEGSPEHGFIGNESESGRGGILGGREGASGMIGSEAGTTPLFILRADAR